MPLPIRYFHYASPIRLFAAAAFVFERYGRCRLIIDATAAT